MSSVEEPGIYDMTDKEISETLRKVKQQAKSADYTGMSDVQIYRVKGAAAWTSINLSSLINKLSETIRELRYKPTSTNSASQTVCVKQQFG